MPDTKLEDEPKQHVPIHEHIGRLIVKPKDVALDAWNWFWKEQVWTNPLYRTQFGIVVGACATFVLLSISRLLGYDLLYFLPTNMRAPLLLSIPALRNAAWIDDIHFTQETLDNIRAAGIQDIDYGSYSHGEDDRFLSLVRHAQSIDFLSYNAAGFTRHENIKQAVTDFFSKPDAKMRVIVADPDTQFYSEMEDMTRTDRRYDITKQDRAHNKSVVDDSIDQLFRLAKYSHQKLWYRKFNTQLRLPLIIVDHKYCIVTVRLPPDESGESLRLESSEGDFDDGYLHPYVQHCIAHFDQLWYSLHPLAQELP